ncbi:M48 family metallopeptidase [Marinoscillum sp. MHG1-6]|uniref:M48 family metallopeptidase n=1 Tax=Marinoscillum sp. MHG1-6 TaxID=2959627 RepID=UPI0021579613|nr:M48 family metallopeptidase [Marinoscillum sp. MHG1-6]
MIKGIYKELGIIVGIFLLGWVAFTLFKWIPDSPELSVSVETEQEIGDLLAQNIKNQYEVVENDTINQAVFEIKKRLLASIGPTDYDYEICVVKQPMPNAFATLGGHIFIFTGIMELTDSPEELAAVLAHEMGHVEERHVVNKIIKEMGINVVFSILTGSDPILVGEIAKATISSSFDRTQESKADEFALKTLENASLSPRHVSTIFRKLKEQHEEPDARLEFLMSHPNINKRIKEALEYVTAEGFEIEPLAIDWEAVKRNL